MEKKDFLTKDEQKYFENFAQSLDTAIVNQYHGVLQELKVSNFFLRYNIVCSWVMERGLNN